MDASYHGTLLRRFARSGSRGQILPLVALMLAVLAGAAALAVDVGYWRYQERVQQSAADSAAIAGASELSYASGPIVLTAAKNAATLNGFTDDGVNVKVLVNNPPATGPYASSANAVEVIVETKQPGFFARAIGLSPQWVSTRAVALAGSDGRGCIFGLQPSGNSVLINGSTVKTPRCGIISDSSMIVNGATVTAKFIGFAAATATDNGSTYPNNGAHPMHSLPAADPCPSIAGCAYLKSHPPGGGPCMSPTSYTGGSTATFQPGHYCAGVLANGTTNVVFNPGLYQLDAGLTLNGATNVTGNGVTFYNAPGQIIINGTNVSLTAPATGNTAGVLFFQPATDASAFIANGSGGGYSGALYFPGANLTINGNLSSWLLLVGATVTINGSGTNVPSSSFPGANRATLAE